MSQEKLRGWLKLPDGPWPPGHYVLLGLPPGTGTSDEIEARALERLERLRRYQLIHPDEATEGMNLLARALDCLTDPDARRRYDETLGLTAPAIAPPLLALPVDDLYATLFAVVQPVSDASASAASAYDLPILTDEVLLPDIEEVDPDEDVEVLEDAEVVETTDETPQAILLPLTVPPPVPVARLADTPPPGPRRGGPLSPHREIYAELARVRKVLRVWGRARPYFADAERTFSRRTDAVAVMGCLAELRPLLPTVTDLIGAPGRPGNLVAAVARQRLVLDTFRSLLPDQREKLARDFRAAHYRLSGYYDDLRGEIRRLTEKGWTRRRWQPFLRAVNKYPEFAVFPLGVLALVVAFVRSL